MFVYPIAQTPLAPLLGHRRVEDLFSFPRMLERCLEVEVALTESLAETGLIDKEAAHAILRVLGDFEPNLEELSASTLADGMPIPKLVASIRQSLPKEHRAAFHLGATSQDLIDTSLAMALKEFNAELMAQSRDFGKALDQICRQFGELEVMGRTRMQEALPMTFAVRCRGWKRQFLQHSVELKPLAERVQILQLGGPVGDGRAFGATNVAELMAHSLGLSGGASWHSQRGHLATYAAWLATLSGILGKTGQDLAMMAQHGELKLSHAGYSSAMPHKQNPVAAEILVALARFNATLVSGMHHSVVHEQERSGAAWTLEWMILPQICVTAGASLMTANRLFNSIRSIGGD